jgi:hypothetical protein
VPTKIGLCTKYATMTTVGLFSPSAAPVAGASIATTAISEPISATSKPTPPYQACQRGAAPPGSSWRS